jgi:hypothetical protein
VTGGGRTTVGCKFYDRHGFPMEVDVDVDDAGEPVRVVYETVFGAQLELDLAFFAECMTRWNQHATFTRAVLAVQEKLGVVVRQ